MNGSALILTLLKVLAVLALVLLNALFVAAELAMVRIRDSQLASLAAKGNRRAKTPRAMSSRILTPTSGRPSLASRWRALAWAWRSSRSLMRLLAPIFNLAGVTSDPLRHDIALGVGFFINCYLLIVAANWCPKPWPSAGPCRRRC